MECHLWWILKDRKDFYKQWGEEGVGIMDTLDWKYIGRIGKGKFGGEFTWKKA